MSYKSAYTLEQRQAQFKKLNDRFPDKILIIVEQAKNSQIEQLLKNKFILSVETTVGEVLELIRSIIQLRKDQAIFLYTKGVLPSASKTLSQIYPKYKDEDGFLYIVYAGETAFG